jgi:hypothetical protein
MTKHNLFYYPYASFTEKQLPLLKVAALYFDKLYILDPQGASWDSIGIDDVTLNAINSLKDAGILKIVTPSTVLASYEEAIAEAIRLDMQNLEFLNLCDAHSKVTGKQHWTLSLSKVPQELQNDKVMRRLMGDFASEVSGKTANETHEYREHQSDLLFADEQLANQFLQRQKDYEQFRATGKAYDEYRESQNGIIEYRYADYPLALGESIMMNHAMFAGLLHSKATPITDVPFHNQALSLKLNDAVNNPGIQKILTERIQQRQLKADILAYTGLTDSELNLPILNSELPLEVILEYRENNNDVLQASRDKLGKMARRIESEPWSEDFFKVLEHEAIPDLLDELAEATKARDAWLKSQRGRLALKGTGVAVGIATAVLAVFAVPATPIALATAGLGLAAGAVLPGTEWLLDWRDGKKKTQENGLHYLLST